MFPIVAEALAAVGSALSGRVSVCNLPNPMKPVRLALIVYLIAFVCAAQDSSKLPVFDLEKGTLQGKELFSYSMDDITDLLGRPSTVQEYPPSLFFHDLGLYVSFEDGQDASTRRVKSVIIFLSRTLDKQNQKYFIPFQGKLNKGIDCNWKIDRVQSELTGVQLKDDGKRKMYALIEGMDALEERSGKQESDLTKAARELTALDTSLRVPSLAAETSYGRLRVVYEEMTRFIEKIGMERPLPKQSSAQPKTQAP